MSKQKAHQKLNQLTAVLMMAAAAISPVGSCASCSSRSGRCWSFGAGLYV